MTCAPPPTGPFALAHVSITAAANPAHSPSARAAKSQSRKLAYRSDQEETVDEEEEAEAKRQAAKTMRCSSSRLLASWPWKSLTIAAASTRASHPPPPPPP